MGSLKMQVRPKQHSSKKNETNQKNMWLSEPAQFVAGCLVVCFAWFASGNFNHSQPHEIKCAKKPQNQKKQHWDNPSTTNKNTPMKPANRVSTPIFDRSKIQCEFITVIRAFLVRLGACVELQVKSVQRFVVHKNACKSQIWNIFQWNAQPEWNQQRKRNSGVLNLMVRALIQADAKVERSQLFKDIEEAKACMDRPYKEG